MAASAFESLPVEVFEAINVFLDLQELCNVRLTSRIMASMATQNHFQSFQHSRRVEMTRPALEALADLTAKNRIGCFVEELTLVGVVYNTAGLEHQLQMRTKTLVGRGCEWTGMLDEPSEPGTAAELAHATAELDKMKRKQADYDQFHESGGDIALLTVVFRNLAANAKRRGLVSLSIDVAEYRQDTKTTQPASHRLAWRSVWHMAEETFHDFAISLGAVRLPIQELNFFYNEFSGRCSLQCNQLSGCDWQASGTVFTLANVESLSISISDRVLNETAYDAVATGDPVERTLAYADAAAGRLVPNENQLKKQLADDGNFSGLVTLLNGCKKLRKLDLRRCYVHRRRWELGAYKSEKFIQHLAQATRLDNLQALSLGNFVVREQDLMILLQRHPVRDLKLVNISLYPGVWDDILEHCTTNMHALHLEDLSQNDLMMLFGDGREEIEESLLKGLPKSQTTYIRRSNDYGKPIAWQIPRYTRLEPDPMGDEGFERLINKFGPPATQYRPDLYH